MEIIMHRTVVAAVVTCVLLVNGQQYARSSECGCLEEPVRGRHQKDRFCRPHLTPLSERRKVRSCVCRPGLVRNSWGDCITKKECLHCKCFRDKDFNVCRKKCPLFCNEPIRPSCSQKCVLGCDCAPGTLLEPRTKKKCVKTTKCMPRCPPQSRFEVCISTCAPKCGKKQPKFCVTRCQRGGCVCFEGYSEAERDGELVCVPNEQCGRYAPTAVPAAPGGYEHNGTVTSSVAEVSGPGSVSGYPSGTYHGVNTEGVSSTYTNQYGEVGGGWPWGAPSSEESMESFENTGTKPRDVHIYGTGSGLGSEVTASPGTPSNGSVGIGEETNVGEGNGTVNVPVVTKPQSPSSETSKHVSGMTSPSNGTVTNGGIVGVGVGIGTAGPSGPAQPGGPGGETHKAGSGTNVIPNGTIGNSGVAITVVGAPTATPVISVKPGSPSGSHFGETGTFTPTSGTTGISSTAGHTGGISVMGSTTALKPEVGGVTNTGAPSVPSVPVSSTAGTNVVGSTGAEPTSPGSRVTAIPRGGATRIYSAGSGVTATSLHGPAGLGGNAVTGVATTGAPAVIVAQPGGHGGIHMVLPTTATILPIAATTMSGAGSTGAATTAPGSPGTTISGGAATGIHTAGPGATATSLNAPTGISGSAVTGVVTTSAPAVIAAQPAGHREIHIAVPATPTIIPSAATGIGLATLAGAGTGSASSSISTQPGTYVVQPGVTSAPLSTTVGIGGAPVSGVGIIAASLHSAALHGSTLGGTLTGVPGTTVSSSAPTVIGGGAVTGGVTGSAAPAALARPGVPGGSYSGSSAIASMPSSTATGASGAVLTGVGRTGMSSPSAAQPGGVGAGFTGGTGVTSVLSSGVTGSSGSVLNGGGAVVISPGTGVPVGAAGVTHTGGHGTTVIPNGTTGIIRGAVTGAGTAGPTSPISAQPVGLGGT